MENVKVFYSYDGEWLGFIFANRKLMPVLLFDAVEGGVVMINELYMAGDMSKDEALKRLKYEKPNHQICFLNQSFIDKSLKYLREEEL